jgi:hypothetical protein
MTQAWLGEIGPAPHEYFASHEKLASWVTLCPGNHGTPRRSTSRLAGRAKGSAGWGLASISASHSPS